MSFKKPKNILILGRPNVGKSTLINRIIRKKKAITLDVPGVTRDLSNFPAKWDEKEFLITDSAGVVFGKSEDYLQPDIEELVSQAIEDAYKVIFMVDSTAGVTPLDTTISQKLRRHTDKVFLAVNKVDDPERDWDSSVFFKLGYGKPYPISSLHGHGLNELMSTAVKELSESDRFSSFYSTSYKVAIVGRPNVGKSSLINAIMNESKVLVDDKAGTTRDSTEVYFQHEKNRYVFIDTAGLRKKAKVKESIEFYSTVRAKRSIEESDIVVFVTNVDGLLTDQDKKILSLIQDANKNMIFFINKWDLTERTDHFRRKLAKQIKVEFPLLENFPIKVGSALEKINLGQLFSEIPKVIERGERRVSTSELNFFVNNIMKKSPPTSKKGTYIKIYYGTQVDIDPPHFIFFINHPKLVKDTYKRFLEKQLREYFGGFSGNPLKIHFKGHRKETDA